MTIDADIKREALALLEPVEGVPPLSMRAIARQLGVSLGSVRNWAHEAGVPAPATPTTAQSTAVNVLKKVDKLLPGLQDLDPDGQMKRSTAVKNLVDSYLKLSGTPSGDDQQSRQQVAVIVGDLIRKAE